MQAISSRPTQAPLMRQDILPRPNVRNAIAPHMKSYKTDASRMQTGSAFDHGIPLSPNPSSFLRTGSALMGSGGPSPNPHPSNKLLSSTV